MFIPTKPFQLLDLTNSFTIEAYCFPEQAIPYVVKSLLRRQYASNWAEGQHVIGRDMIARCVVSLYGGCRYGSSIAVDRVYRLLDFALFGTEYVPSTDPDGRPSSVPPIPAVPSSTFNPPESLVTRSKQIALAIDNLVSGDANTLYTDTRNVRQQLDDIIAALQAGGEEDFAEILPVLQAIATALV